MLRHEGNAKRGGFQQMGGMLEAYGGDKFDRQLPGDGVYLAVEGHPAGAHVIAELVDTVGFV